MLLIALVVKINLDIVCMALYRNSQCGVGEMIENFEKDLSTSYPAEYGWKFTFLPQHSFL
jgi:hypothetical protein